MSKFEDMGKNELRAACKAAGISYGKLNNDGMRAALVAAEKSAPKSYTQSVAEKTDTGSMKELEGNKLLPPVDPVQTAAKVAAATGRKIEKDREERNGVKRPSVGGTCRAVWDELDRLVSLGTQPSAKDVKELASAHGWNFNNASIELYQWRRFNGIKGRQKGTGLK